MRISRRTVASLALTAAAAFLVGCSSPSGPSHAGNISAIRSNPTPELNTIGGRRADTLNRRTVSVDTNLRMFTEDFERLILIDRPSRLNMYPTTR
ncbi:MAG: hypothetical protein LAT64_04645 [Phycisphaerales bacterium]|nr:hypothetical protein [Phycisphaerales bacterium]